MNIREKKNQGDEKSQMLEDIEVSKAISALRKSYLLSISEFSMKTGYSRVHISEVESGKRKAAHEMIDNIRNVFHLGPDWPVSENRQATSNDSTQHPKINEQEVLSSIEATAVRLLSLRRELNINQKDFSRLTGISVSILEDVTYGRRRLTMRMAKRIEDACNIGTEWLLHGDEDAKDHPCGQRMTSFLKRHPAARDIVWEMMVHEND